MDRLEKYKKRIMDIVSKEHYVSVMNNTKWHELQNGVYELPFPPPYIMKTLIDDSIKSFEGDVTYVGNWDDEVIKPFFGIHWIEVRPRYLKSRGRLVEPEIVDETIEFVELLNKYTIPFEERNGTYYIYGYK